MSFISSEIEWVSASMTANILVFNVCLIPTVTFVTAESDEPCLPVTVPPADRGLSSTVKQEKGRGASRMKSKCYLRNYRFVAQ